MKDDGHVVRGTRDELLAELEQAKEGWKHFGKPHLAEQAGNGIFQLQAGESSARAGHTTYIVTD